MSKMDYKDMLVTALICGEVYYENGVLLVADYPLSLRDKEYLLELAKIGAELVAVQTNSKPKEDK